MLHEYVGVQAFTYSKYKSSDLDLLLLLIFGICQIKASLPSIKKWYVIYQKSTI